MYEKEINLIDVSFIFLRKLASRECVLRGPKMLKIDYSGGWRGVGWSHVPGYMAQEFLDCWAVGPRVKNSKMITVDKCKPFTFEKGINPLPDDKILDWSKLIQIANDILKCI